MHVVQGNLCENHILALFVHLALQKNWKICSNFIKRIENVTACLLNSMFETD